MLNLTEIESDVDLFKNLESNGFQLQVFPFQNNSVKFFSVQAALTIEHGSVCAFVFLNSYKKPVAASAPLWLVRDTSRCLIAHNFKINSFSGRVVL